MALSSSPLIRAALAGALVLAAGAAFPPAQAQTDTTKKPAAAGASQQQGANGTEAAEAATDPADNKVLLAYRWKTEGPIRYCITTIEQNTTTGSSGAPQEASTEKHVDIVVKPAGEAEKFRTWLEIGWERIQFKLNQGKVAFEVDTAAPAVDAAKAGPFAPLKAGFDAIQGRTVRVLMSPAGRVEKVEGLADIANAVRNAFPADANRDAIVAALFPVTDAQLVDQMSKAVMLLPVKRVEPGFAAPQKVSLGGTDELAGQLVFTGIEGEGADRTLVVTQELSAKPGAPQANAADKMTYIREKFDISSKVVIDADSYTPIRFESTSTTNYAARKANSNPEAAPDKLVQQVVRTETAQVAPPHVPGSGGASGTAPSGSGAETAPPSAPVPPDAPAPPPPSPSAS